LGVLASEAGHSALSLKGVLSIFVGGLVPFGAKLFEWFPDVHPAALVGLTFFAMWFPFSLVLSWNLTRDLDGRLWFGRRYKSIVQRWHYSLNPDGKTLRGELMGERHVVCLQDTIDFLNIPVSPAENLVPFDPADKYEVLLDPQSRYEGGEILPRPPHRKEGSSFAVHFDFAPPLRPGDEAFVKFRIVLPRYKAATLDYMRERQSIGALDAKDFQVSSFNIQDPTETFVFELDFDSSCKVRPRSPEALRGECVQPEETRELQQDGAYSATKGPDGGWTLRLMKKNPPVRMKYRLSWSSPRAAELVEH